MGVHRLFTGRTVILGKKGIDVMLNQLNGTMKQHGLLTKIKLGRRFEKPTTERIRKENELCVRVYQRGLMDKYRLLGDAKSTR